jgi:hypothetical protein
MKITQAPDVAGCQRCGIKKLQRDRGDTRNNGRTQAAPRVDGYLHDVTGCGRI